MLKEIHKVIKESSLSVEHKKYVMALVFQDIANKEVNAVLQDLEEPKVSDPKADVDLSEGAE